MSNVEVGAREHWKSRSARSASCEPPSTAGVAHCTPAASVSTACRRVRSHRASHPSRQSHVQRFADSRLRTTAHELRVHVHVRTCSSVNDNGMVCGGAHRVLSDAMLQSESFGSVVSWFWFRFLHVHKQSTQSEPKGTQGRATLRALHESAQHGDAPELPDRAVRHARQVVRAQRPAQRAQSQFTCG